MVGIVSEQSPQYKMLVELGGRGYNTGVMLMWLERMRRSQLYQRVVAGLLTAAAAQARVWSDPRGAGLELVPGQAQQPHPRLGGRPDPLLVDVCARRAPTQRRLTLSRRRTPSLTPTHLSLCSAACNGVQGWPTAAISSTRCLADGIARCRRNTGPR